MIEIGIKNIKIDKTLKLYLDKLLNIFFDYNKRKISTDESNIKTKKVIEEIRNDKYIIEKYYNPMRKINKNTFNKELNFVHFINILYNEYKENEYKKCSKKGRNKFIRKKYTKKIWREKHNFCSNSDLMYH